MNQQQKEKAYEIIQNTLGIEDIKEIALESEFIADLNASIEEVKNIIKLTQELLNIQIELIEPIENLTIQKFFESIEESLI